MNWALGNGDIWISLFGMGAACWRRVAGGVANFVLGKKSMPNGFFRN